MEKRVLKLGIDVGSTTLKMVVLDSVDNIIYRSYIRHKGDVSGVFVAELDKIMRQFSNAYFIVMITGSAGMGIAERIQIPFAQEVVAAVAVIKKYCPQAKTLIDLGGEDSKMVFFEDGKQPDIRMNGSCAGGTGAFIDQMADLMNITIEELGNLALQGKKVYPVASRCGVFAKTDVQNLISRNISTADIALSILHAVALQSITTLARGCTIGSPMICIGGPLTFLPALRRTFQDILKLEENKFILPENSEYFPALGCALLNSDRYFDLQQIINKIKTKEVHRTDTLPALFGSETEYRQWKENRNVKHLNIRTGSTSPLQSESNLFLGIDSGSTTTKILIIDENENIVFTFYAPNQGNPLKKVAEGLQKFEKQFGGDKVMERIVSSCSTGYGEELIQSAFNLDYGIVETVAHFTGAQYIDPNVSFILDIGGQDMKSIFVSNGVISRIELNEACSSGCGSFLQNFAATMNLSLQNFTEMACLAKYPADLGTRCTVFMNSKVKQSLREDASIGDIAAGLAYSVVKNCLFKVLKINNLNSLGNNIVVQGGTFRNDAVYRAIELLSEKNVSSTDMPEMMGALGAGLYAKNRYKAQN
ncbi:MAG: BadF/BadG/BcrA/BcrD ATPase family protein [Paludibacter sp.]|nr:BadF/BadG/BcrA/BcrD ATPase family protein [Paludibacter sp.]